jgi:dTDP-4-amino-4,6-dideoxygalactose transaminase
MKVPFVDLKAQYRSIKPEIDNAIASVFEEGNFVGGGFVKKFESQFSGLHQTKHCITLGNGTDALHAALKMLGISPGDEVLTPALSWISSAETITLAGGIPVFIDIDPLTHTIDPNRIEEKISQRTKAIVVVHLYGHIADMRSILEIAERNNLRVVEDCAHAHLAERDYKKAGTFADAGCFSFYPTKNLGAYGDGGCVITDDDDLAKNLRRFTNHGGLTKDEHLIEGMNSRLDSLQAAILIVKLKHLGSWTEKRIQNARRYDSLLRETDGINLPAVQADSRHAFHLYVVKARRRDELKEYLKHNGIETSIHYPIALPFEPAYQYLNCSKKDFPVATTLTREILSLPIYPELSDDQIGYVCEKIKQFFL